MTREETLDRLRRALPALSRDYGVARIGLFGSVARGEARPHSDVDLIVEFEPGRAPGFGFFDMEEALARLLGRRVEVTSLDLMNSVVRAQVMRDLAYA